jgi:hypothetical protein
MCKLKRKILNIYHHTTSEEHYNIKILIEFENKYLIFNSLNFSFLNKSDYTLKKKWKKLNYDCITEDVFLKKIREDESTTYFIEFSNDDILYVSQNYDGETWWQEFKITNKLDNFYLEIYNYMNEEFVQELNIETIG